MRSCASKVVEESRASVGAASPLSASAVKKAMFRAWDSPRTYAMKRSWSSTLISSRSAMVAAKSSMASAVAAGAPTSTKMMWRPERSSVSGPNMGCNDVTRHPASARARRPDRNGVLREPTSKTSPRGRASASSARIPADTARGAATTTTS